MLEKKYFNPRIVLQSIFYFLFFSAYLLSFTSSNPYSKSSQTPSSEFTCTSLDKSSSPLENNHGAQLNSCNQAPKEISFIPNSFFCYSECVNNLKSIDLTFVDSQCNISVFKEIISDFLGTVSTSCSYYFLRLNVLSSQAHPPTL